ncbi:MAG: hypothetical protein DME22_18415 [Verrucomicrobia bacterium]|nr:MAG: hypothetical protein DME22_18415 [Verrucomicrobiota bacterium]
MPTQLLSHDDCECCSGITRRTFLKATVVGAAAVAASPLPSLAVSQAEKAATKKATSETLVTTLFKSLNEEQQKPICFPFDHPLRSKVDNNWMITDKKISEFFTNDQQALIREIFTGLHSPEYAGKVMQQVEHDGGKEGFGGCSIALFGRPGTGDFEFVLAGRHVTRRCDGDSVEGAAFGGPIFYGHAAKSFNEPADHPGNVYWYQARRANEVFKMLDGKQREMALLDEPREEKGTDTVRLTGKTDLPGIPVAALSRDQKQLVRKVMADVLAPFRKADADEALKLIEKNGFDNLHMSFYKNEDIGHDGVWDIWQIEGPAMLWFFRGAPHVHTWVHVREKA